MFSLSTLFSDPLLFVAGFVALIVSIGIHEFAHVLAAYLQGDQTGKMLGRLTLNPIRHLDVIGTIAILLIGLGWGKPAPFNPYNLRYRRWGSAVVAIAGPISNVVMMVLSGYVLVILGSTLPPNNLLTIFLQTLLILNAALAVFNLIPVAPLDGSHILKAVLGANNALVITLERYGMYILLALMFLGSGILGVYLQAGTKVLLSIFGLNRPF